MADERQVYIRLRSKSTGAWFVHPDLRPTLIAAADEADTSLTDLVNQILARRFKVSYAPSGRRSRPSEGDEEQLTIRLSEPTRRKIMRAAIDKGEAWQDVLRRALCDEYGLEMPDAVAA